VRREDAAVVLSLTGELDLAGVEALSKTLAEAEGLCPETLVLDLSRLEFLDSSGLSCILEAHARANNAGRRLALLGGPRAVHRVFELTGMDKHLKFVEVDTVDQWRPYRESGSAPREPPCTTSTRHSDR